MDLEVEGPAAQSPETEPGMNIISADFDLIMVNRPNERLYGKPMVELLGKKCYREFEKRDEPCPHCPGRRSLLTGGTHEEETEGLRDDGTWFSARVRTHPVQGLGDIPTGFIEVVEDITEEKRAEKLGRIEAELRAALTVVQNVRRALTIAFQAALRVESIDSGGVFLLAGRSRAPELVMSAGLSEKSLRMIEERAREQAPGDLLQGVSEAPRSVTVVPILHRGEPVATLVAASKSYPAIPPTLVAGLHSVGATVAGAIGRIWAEQSRGDAVADLESIITHAPIAAFILDPAECVTMWNKAAERLFGWKATEVVRRPCPFPVLSEEVLSGIDSVVTRERVLQTKDGCSVDTRLTLTRFRDVVGVASTVIVMVEDLTSGRRLQELEACLAAREGAGGSASSGEDQSTPAHQRPVAGAGSRVLLLDGDEGSRELAQILEALGYEPLTSASVGEAAESVARAEGEGLPIALAVVEVIAHDGSSALARRAALRAAGLRAPVLLSSDSAVSGYREHGFAGVLRRPHTPEEVQGILREALKP